MKFQDRSSDKTTDSGAPSSSKKKYEKPAFRHERVFETMALACSKVSRVEPQCHFNTTSRS